MARKFIYYLKGFSRTIVITDKDESRPIEEIVDKISKCMSGCKVFKFETDNDILIVRPSDIMGIHIAKDSLKHDVDYNGIEESQEECIKLQNIVPDIDLGDIDTKDLKTIEEIETIEEIGEKLEEDSPDNIVEEKEIEDTVEELSDDDSPEPS